MPAPGTSIRLLFWFGIYLAAQVPIIWRLGSAYFPSDLFLFPSYVGLVLVVPLNLMPEAVSYVLAFAVIPLGYVAGYIVYPLHLMATLRTRTYRRFGFLLLDLAAIALMNLIIQWTMVSAVSS